VIRSLLITFLFLTSANLFGEGSALSESDKVRWLGGNYGPQWIEKQQESKVETKEPSPGAKLSPLWLPMCFFFDPSVDAAVANKKIRTIAQAYGACGIALDTHTFTMRPDYPNNAKALKVAAEKACPFVSAYGVRGAVQVETRFPEVPKQMCEDPEAEGCSTLCSEVSVSFVKPNAGPSIGLHESMHSNCCGPLCVDTGEGTGITVGAGVELATFLPDEINLASTSKKSAVPPLIKENGCEALRAGASANNFTHWYEPERKEYFAVEKDPSKQKDLLEGKNLLPNVQVAFSLPEVPKSDRAPASVAVPATNATKDWVPVTLPDTSMIAPVTKKPTASAAEEDSEDEEEGRGRKRGAALRKGKGIARKGGDSGVGSVDAYAGAGE